LRHRNFRLYWFSQLVSLSGTWMCAVAQGWLVLELTNQPFWLGAVGAAGTLPVLAFSLIGGVAADRFPKRSLLVATQSVSTAVALALGLLTLSGQIRVWQVLTAIALNSLTFNAARVSGPAVAGMIVASAGTAACFLINAASFVPVIAALRGRIMSMFTLVLMGAMPLGNILIGALAGLIGTMTAVATFGVGLCAAIGIVTLARRELFTAG